MPTFLSITHRKEQGIGRRILANLYRGKPKLTQYHIGEATLRYITYERKKKSVPWDLISRMAGEDCDRLVCSTEIALPEDYGLYRFVPSRFGGLMARNALFSVLSVARVSPGNLKIALFDPCAQYMATAEKLMAYCSQLRVLTEDLIRYRKAEEEIMERCGGIPLISNHPRDIQDCHILFAPGRWNVSLSGMEGSLLFTGIPPAVPFHGLAFWRYHVPLPEIYREYCPLAVENFTYLAALYEQCHIQKLERLIPDGCICGREVYSPKRLAELLEKTVK